MLVETPVSPRVPRIRFLQTSIKIKKPPKKPGGILILVASGNMKTLANPLQTLGIRWES